MVWKFRLGVVLPSFAVSAMIFVQPPLVFSQDANQDPVSAASIHAGPLGMNPRITLLNAGVDNNVFNESTNPKRDVTFTVQPSLDVLMRTKRGLLSAIGRLDLVYFKTYASERSVNGYSQVTYEYRFNRFRPFVSLNALDTRERPGYEIDTRARRFEDVIQAGLDSRVASKSNVQFAVRRQTVSYADDAAFAGRRLEDVLNRTLQAVDLTWRQRLTALTTVAITASSEQERFKFSPARDSNGFRLKGGVELGRFALIRGTAFLGYRRLTPATASTIPEFSGIISDVNVAYTAPTRTRFSVGVTRDIQYSFEIINPYYVQTDWSAGLTQRVIGRWEVRFSGAQDRLDYRTNRSVVNGRADRVDRVVGGIGYVLTDETSVGFNVESSYRNSNEPGHKYQSIRSFGSVNHAF